ncbi:MAG: cobalamin biosynthesis protein CbiA [Desulfococcaceae bacterium]
MGRGIDLQGIIILVGNYGSGKTEVAVNLAAERRNAGFAVRIADLDLVNPYFRTREARKPLRDLGIDVVLPPEPYMHADLPILAPAVAGMIRDPAPVTLLDAGGDDVGATVLAALAAALKDRAVRMIQVVNPFRPFTDSLEGCRQIRAEIEAASRLSVNGLIGNANLIDETDADVVREGYAFCRDLSRESGLPLECITVPVDLLPEVEGDPLDCPVLPIHRQLVPPWRPAAKLGFGAL